MNDPITPNEEDIDPITGVRNALGEAKATLASLSNDLDDDLQEEKTEITSDPDSPTTDQ